MTCMPLSYAKDLSAANTLRQTMLQDKLHSSTEINSIKTGVGIHVAPAISWLRLRLLVVAAAGRWRETFRSVKRHIDMLVSIAWFFLSKPDQTPDQVSQSLYPSFPGDRLQLPLKVFHKLHYYPFHSPVVTVCTHED
jgi:hypothetical protein